MPKYAFKTFLLFTLLVFSFGCSSKEIHVRNYMQDKPRVDQEITGKVGNWQNSPDAVYTATKDTRKIYVLEVTQDADTIVEKTIIDEESYQQPVVNTYEKKITESRKVAYQEPEIVLPSFDDGSLFDDTQDDSRVVTTEASISFVEYTVGKDDTLQKISKKFYDSYSKWPRIYEVNKAKIKDPDRIKPGIVLRIPMD